MQEGRECTVVCINSTMQHNLHVLALNHTTLTYEIVVTDFFGQISNCYPRCNFVVKNLTPGVEFIRAVDLAFILSPVQCFTSSPPIYNIHSFRFWTKEGQLDPP